MQKNLFIMAECIVGEPSVNGSSLPVGKISNNVALRTNYLSQLLLLVSSFKSCTWFTI